MIQSGLICALVWILCRVLTVYWHGDLTETDRDSDRNRFTSGGH